MTFQNERAKKHLQGHFGGIKENAQQATLGTLGIIGRGFRNGIATAVVGSGLDYGAFRAVDAFTHDHALALVTGIGGEVAVVVTSAVMIGTGLVRGLVNATTHGTKTLAGVAETEGALITGLGAEAGHRLVGAAKKHGRRQIDRLKQGGNN